MPYSSNHTNRNTIFDAGDTIEGDHIKSLYDELGADPSGASADLTTRLNALESAASAETIRDTIAAFAVAGDGMTIVHDDAGNTLTFTADEVAAIAAELGVNPSGSFETVAARLADMDNRIAQGGTPPVDPGPGSSPDPADFPLPVDFTQTHLFDFGVSTGATATDWKTADGGVFDTYTGRQGGGNTRSVNLDANVTVDNALGAMRLKSTADTTNSFLYSSAYVGTGLSGTDAQRYFPLFGRYEFMVRYPMTHAHWNGMWINYRGSATSGFEIDFGEQFNAQTPGRVSMNNHRENPDRSINFSSASSGQAVIPYTHADAAWIGRPVSSSVVGAIPAGTTIASVNPGTSFTLSANLTASITSLTVTTPYGTNQFNGAIGQTTHLVPSASALWSGTTAATRYGKAYDWDEPNGVGTTGHSGWHKLWVWVEKIDGSLGGWTIRIHYGIDDVEVAYWTDTTCNHTAGGRPMFIDHSLSQDYAWDMRLTSWVGGTYHGQCDTSTSTSAGGSRVLVYNGLNGLGTTANMYANNGTIYGAKLWDDDITADYHLDCAWIRISTKDAEPTPPARTYLFKATSTGTDEAAVSTGTYSGGAFEGVALTNGTAVYDTDQYVADGVNTQAVRHNLTSGSQSLLQFDPSGSTTWPNLWARCWLRFEDLPSTATRVMLTYPSGGGTSLSQVRIATTGQVELQDNFVNVDTSAFNMVADTWYCLSWNLNTVANTQELRLYNLAGTLLDTLQGACAGAETGRVAFGVASSANQTLTAWTDGHLVDDQDWIGPTTE